MEDYAYVTVELKFKKTIEQDNDLDVLSTYVYHELESISLVDQGELTDDDLDAISETLGDSDRYLIALSQMAYVLTDGIVKVEK